MQLFVLEGVPLLHVRLYVHSSGFLVLWGFKFGEAVSGPGTKWHMVSLF